MSERRERLLGVLHLKARMAAAQLNARLSAVQAQQYREFDVADRVRAMRAHSALPPGARAHEGDLSAAAFLGRALSEQLTASQDRSAELSKERAALEAELRHALARESTIKETRAETAKATRSARAELEDKKAEGHRQGRPSQP